MVFADSSLYYAQRANTPLLLIYAHHLKANALFNLDEIDVAMQYLAAAATIGEQNPALFIAQYRQTLAALASDQDQLRENSYTLSVQNRLLIILAIGGWLVYARSKRLQKQQKQLQRRKAQAEAAVYELSKQAQKKHLILNNKVKIYLGELRHIKADGNYVEFYVRNQKHLDKNRLK